MIEAGSRIGTYEVVAPLGSGGMGEVYRARDTKLGRDVALKILPEPFALDPERLARFKREAQVLALLNHPHIAAIYGFEDSGDTHALVLELVEGPTLADRIAEGPIPIAESLTIAKPIAEAIEAAHEQGIIHRDLKPANVKIRPDGTVKVLDFGLAKLVDNKPDSAGAIGLSHSPTITTPAMTMAGVILGTASYMSPEQAKGRPADKRSDVWAFGCVLFEMLTGRGAFEGEDVTETIAAVVRGEPDWAALPADAPAVVRLLLKGCLEKDRRQRIADISTVLFAMRQPAIVVPPSEPQTVVHDRQPAWRRAIPGAAGAALAIALTSLAWWMLLPAKPTPAVTRFSILLGEGERFTDPFLPIVAISPDGTQLAYVANRRLYLRSLSELGDRPIPGTEVTTGFLGGPMFSPNSRSLAFWVGTGVTSFALKRVELSGGAPVTISQATFPFGASWDSSGIVFGQAFVGEHGIMRVSASGGKPETIVHVKNDEVAQSPQVLPDGDAVLYTLTKGFIGESTTMTAEMWDKARIVVQPLKGAERKTLIENGSDGRYMPSGHLVYAVSGTLLAAPFDARRREVTGGPVSVVEGVLRPTTVGNGPGGLHFSVSNSGTLVYVPGPATASANQTNLVIVDRKGNAEALNTPRRAYEFPRVSPDEKRLAVGTDDDKGANIWIYDLAGTSVIRQLTFGGKNRFPTWAGNDTVAFQSDRDGDSAIFVQDQSGTKLAQRLTKPEPGTLHVPESFSPDGRTLLYDVIKDGRHSLWMLMVSDRQSKRFSDVEAYQTAISSMFSPDGKWVAYGTTRQEDAAMEVMVQPFPPTGAKFSVSPGAHPMWSRDGKELIFSTQGQITIVPIATRPTVTAGPGVIISRPIVSRGTQERNRDGLSDGRIIGVSVLTSPNAPASQIQVVLNWFEDLKARAGAGR